MPPPRSKPTGECQALEADESTRCNKKPLERKFHCAVHLAQYQTLTKKYKEAQRVVDKMGGTPRLTDKAIADISDVKNLLAEYERVRTLQDAVRVEKTGREVHHKRFFLKADAGHKTRLNFLEKKMRENAKVLDQLDARHYYLRNVDDPEYKAWIKRFQSHPLRHLAAVVPEDAMGHASVQIAPLPGVESDNRDPSNNDAPSGESEEDDPITVAFRKARRDRLQPYEWLTVSFDEWIASLVPAEVIANDTAAMREIEIHWTARVQYYRRLILHDPVLANKAYDKVSFLDLFHSPDFTLEDCDRLFGSVSIMGDALIWWKDSFLDALDIRPSIHKRRDGAQVVRDIQDNRVKLLGQWVYSRQHSKPLPPEGWFYFERHVKIVKNIENRVVRLFHDFNDMHTYFILSGLLSQHLVPDRVAPIKAARLYLTMAGFIIDELIGHHISPSGPVPSTLPASRRGYRTWAQFERRPYLIGALRDDPEDSFNKAFLAELRSRPDLFIVVNHSVTHHRDGEVEQFGGPSGETYFCMRSRTFEAPASAFAPSGSGAWDVHRTAANTLFGGGKPLKVRGRSTGVKTPLGYMNLLRERPNGQHYMFTHVKFPVRYLVVMDVDTNGNGQNLTTYVVWAALRALGLVQGWQPNPAAIDIASSRLMLRRMSKLLDGEWLPKEMRDHLLFRDDPVMSAMLSESSSIDPTALYRYLEGLNLDMDELSEI